MILLLSSPHVSYVCADIEKWSMYLDAVRAQLLKSDPASTMTKLYNDLNELHKTRDSQSPVYPHLLALEKLDVAIAAAYNWGRSSVTTRYWRRY